jgi:hypothetical protein
MNEAFELCVGALLAERCLKCIENKIVPLPKVLAGVISLLA